MPCLGAPLTLAACEHFKRNYLCCRERGQALGKLTLASLLSQGKQTIKKKVGWQPLKPVSGVCMHVQSAAAGVR